MGKYIVKLDGKYLEWSTVVDAPITYGMTRQAMIGYLIEEHGASSAWRIPERLERVDKNGTSAHDTMLEALIRSNRAGENEETLSESELIAMYC